MDKVLNFFLFYISCASTTMNTQDQQLHIFRTQRHGCFWWISKIIETPVNSQNTKPLSCYSAPREFSIFSVSFQSSEKRPVGLPPPRHPPRVFHCSDPSALKSAKWGIWPKRADPGQGLTGPKSDYLTAMQYFYNQWWWTKWLIDLLTGKQINFEFFCPEAFEPLS